MIKETLNLALIQSHIAWENPVQNRAVFEENTNAIFPEVDVIILPEMFTTGFTMNAVKVCESMDGETIEWMKKMAVKKNCAVCGSIVIREENKFYNRFIFVEEHGRLYYYDKHQLFTLAREEETYTAGQDRVIIEYKGWKIKPQVCYDLRFPVWARNTEAYDILLYVASWPKKRIQAWDTLLKARAIENMSYCIGVNRVGLDGNGYEYNGHSGVYDVLGNTILEENSLEKESILYAVLNHSHIQKIRKRLGFLNDADRFDFL
ncbi:nitrilase family protein [Aquimarina addita]|uniref:Nitrilase family protein n=1 Tax=Aquimarina addita TaxID=870485 RepID=A0ABP7XI50_9FLAO